MLAGAVLLVAYAALWSRLERAVVRLAARVEKRTLGHHFLSQKEGGSGFPRQVQAVARSARTEQPN